jgi:hypothetical protein
MALGNGSGPTAVRTAREPRDFSKSARPLISHTAPRIENQGTVTPRLSRRPPNKIFRDELFIASGVETISLDLAGGGTRCLQAVLESEDGR